MKKHIEKIFKLKEARNWDTIYWAVDVHDTCIVANYKAGEIPTEFFPHAKEVLQMISERKDCCLILYTCSYPKEIEKYLEFFKSHNINFKYVNKNPEAENTAFGHFEVKFYFNILLEDKAGFDAEEDWIKIKEVLQTLK